MKNEEAKQRAKNYMSLKGALEPKQIKCYCGHTTMCDCSPLDEPKQETLEEVAKKYAENKSSAEVFQEAHIIDFKAGAKWMREELNKQV